MVVGCGVRGYGHGGGVACVGGGGGAVGGEGVFYEGGAGGKGDVV